MEATVAKKVQMVTVGPYDSLESLATAVNERIQRLCATHDRVGVGGGGGAKSLVILKVDTFPTGKRAAPGGLLDTYSTILTLKMP